MTKGSNSEQIDSLSRELFQAIQKEHAELDGIRPADTDKQHVIKNTLDEFTKERGRPFFFQYLSSGRGHGPFTELIDGSVKYDLINGIGVNLLGHGHPVYTQALLEAARTDTIMCGNLQPYPITKSVTSSILKSVKKSRLRHFWFAGSGSFANDLALKIVWQKSHPRSRIIAFEKGFSGRSVATQELTHNKAYRDGMPENLSVHHIPHFNYDSPEQSTEDTLRHLNELWEQYPGEFSAMVLELVQGEGGFIFGDRDYYVSIFEWCKERDIYIWIDEVQTFGRTQELFAFQQFGLDEYVDVVTVGKALQSCGVLYTEELNPKPGLIAGTFNGSIAALTASDKILTYLNQGGFFGKEGHNAKLSEKCIAKMRHLKSHTLKDKLGGFYSIGTMLAFEVGDATKETTTKYLRALFDKGIMAFSAGSNPTRVRFLLPTCLTDQHLAEIFSIVEQTMMEVIE